jgi:hypothetical protein
VIVSSRCVDRSTGKDQSHSSKQGSEALHHLSPRSAPYR